MNRGNLTTYLLIVFVLLCVVFYLLYVCVVSDREEHTALSKSINQSTCLTNRDILYLQIPNDINHKDKSHARVGSFHTPSRRLSRLDFRFGSLAHGIKKHLVVTGSASSVHPYTALQCPTLKV